MSYFYTSKSPDEVLSSPASLVDWENAVPLGTGDVRGSSGEDGNRLGRKTTFGFVGLSVCWLYRIQTGFSQALTMADFLKLQTNADPLLPCTGALLLRFK